MELFTNIPLIAALTGIIFAQIIKVPITFVITKVFEPRLVFRSSGMLSSHTAGGSALPTSIGVIEGFGTSLAAASFVFSVIIRLDASGLRRQAGMDADLLNELVQDVQYFVDQAREW